MTSPREFLRSARIGKDKDKSKSDRGTFVVEKRKYPRIHPRIFPRMYPRVDPGIFQKTFEAMLVNTCEEQVGPN